MARQPAQVERKLEISHCYGEKKGCDQDKNVALHKEQHTIMESLANHGYQGINDGNNVFHFLQEIKTAELWAAVNIVQTQPKEYGKDFYLAVSYLGQMDTKKV